MKRHFLFLLTLLGIVANAFGQSPATNYTIYNNLGTGNDKYYQGGSTVTARQSIAAAFTPSVNANVNELALGINHLAGMNTVIVSLNLDAGGVPGNAIYGWHLTHLPLDCCSRVVFAADREGIPVTAGTQYWIVAQVPKDSSPVDVWDVTYNLATGLWAFNDNGGGWVTAIDDALPAFAVFGKQAD